MSEGETIQVSIPTPGMLLAVGLLLAALIGAMCVGLPYYRMQQAARTISSLGGEVATKPGGPDWLRDLIGDDRMKCFDCITGVDLNHQAIRSDDLQILSSLTSLEWLWLDGTEVGDDGLQYLCKLTELRHLRLNGTQVGDAGIRYICELPKLRRLELNQTQVTHSGIEMLGTLPRFGIEWRGRQLKAWIYGAY